jgi:hypothetical protein
VSRQFFNPDLNDPGMAEQRKAASYTKQWNLESEMAKLIFFGIELSGL